MEKFERSWQIMRASWDVLRQDKETLAFPVFSGVAVIYIIALSVVQAALQGIFQAALYQYEKKGETPRGFDREILTEAITPRAFG